jgi:hypothetical protein
VNVDAPACEEPEVYELDFQGAPPEELHPSRCKPFGIVASLENVSDPLNGSFTTKT